MNKIDDMSWHLDEDFPKDLSEEAAATPMAMFLGWVIDNHKESAELKKIAGDDLEKFRRREIPLNSIILNYGEKLYREFMDDDSAQFAKKYYDNFYLNDYKTLCDEKDKSLFYMPASWEKYEQVKALIEKRYQDWKNKKNLPKKTYEQRKNAIFYAALMGSLKVILFLIHCIIVPLSFVFRGFYLLASFFSQKKS